MPTTLVKETTVYTLEELSKLSYSAYENAIQKILDLYQDYDWYEETEYLADWVNSESLIEVDKKDRRNSYGNTIYRPKMYWSSYPFELEFEGTISLVDFMNLETENGKKLWLRYRSLFHYILHNYYRMDCQIGFKATGSDYDSRFKDDFSDIESDIDNAWQDKEISKAKRDRLVAQLALVGDILWQYIDEWHSKLLKSIRDNVDYRSSEEFAKEEAEAMELRFTEDGSIYW